MDDFVRYAVYAAPDPGQLADFAAGWLGWDPEAGVARAQPTLSGLPRPLAELAEAPRKYGFHGTLKPPFRLAAGVSRANLETELATLAASLPAVTLDGLALARIGGFLALVPEGDTRGLERLAAEVVAGLDRNRAPASEGEMARRRAAGLSPRQEAHLVHWGYPYVMDEFRFHFTLTGKLSPDEAEATAAILRPLVEPLIPRPFTIGDLCLFGEDRAGMFHILHRYALTG